MPHSRTFLAILILALALMASACTPIAAPAETSTEGQATMAEMATVNPEPLVTSLQGAMGSTVGPDGALYLTEGAAGKISRVDPQTGEISTLVEGLPPAVLPIGGVTDVAFIDGTAYALVTMVGADLPVPVESPGVVGLYRIDGPDSFTVVADLGQWSIDNPSDSEVFIPSGVFYAMIPFGDGFLVTDGHHNRVLYVTLDGEISERMTLGNIVPTGLAAADEVVYMALAGANPHLARDGRIVSFGPEATIETDVASGAPLLVDVEFGSDGALYALSQGDFPEGADDGSPALPDTGALVRANEDGTFSVIAEGLNQPTSLEIIDGTAYIVTLTGEVRRIDNLSSPS